MQKVVLLSGLPGTGKTVLGRYMEHELGWYRVHPEGIREELYGNRFIRDSEQMALAIEHVTRTAIEYCHDALAQERNIVIDSAACNNKRRHELLGPFSDEDRYIVIIEASEDTRVQRCMDRGYGWSSRRTKDEIREIIRREHESLYEEPDLEIPVIRYRNDSPKDLDAIKADLRKRFAEQK